MAKNLQLQLLIDGCRKGNRASQIRLYEHFFGYGMGVCLRYSRNREEALEIVNDGFHKAFSRIEQYDKEQPFKPWLRRILINAAIDYSRKYHKNKGAKAFTLAREETAATTHNKALENLAFEDLLKIMQKLPDAYRMVFNLYVVEHFSHQEIAEKLNISVGASKSNLAKARKKIKSMLGASHGIYLKSEQNGG